ncbi:21057_t:CDS:2, partial [Gigaspora rosea]
MSQPHLQIPEVGDEFLSEERFKEAAQQGAKAAGFTFSVSSSKASDGGKGSHTPFITLQCMMRVGLNENTKVWVVTFPKSEHNHELLPLSQVHCFPQHRHLSTEQKELVHIMLKSWASSQSIADTIHWKHGT